MRILILFIFLFTHAVGVTQSLVDLTFYDVSSDKPLEGVEVYSYALDSMLYADEFGVVQLEFKTQDSLECTLFGYNDTVLVVKNIQPQLIGLVTGSTELSSLIVEATRVEKDIVKSTDIGTVTLTMEDVEKLPALMGEVDILKTLQLLPGVLSAGEGSAGFYVRGGGPDQNLVLLDDMPVYNTGHLLGFFSVFNADAIASTTLIKGDMPANYGGRLSSVVDITAKSGQFEGHELKASVGLLSSKFAAKGAIVKDKLRYNFAARRTYVFDIAQPFVKETSFAGTNYYFYDINGKLDWDINPNHKLSLTLYNGLDKLKFQDNLRDFTLEMPWGNTLVGLQLNSYFGDNWSSRLSLSYSEYLFRIKAVQDKFTLKLNSGINDYTVQNHWKYKWGASNTLKLGASNTKHKLTPNIASASSGDVDFDSGLTAKHALDYAIYATNNHQLTERLRAEYGLRGTMFQFVGPYTADFNGKSYASNEVIEDFYSIEPRVALQYDVDSLSSVKLGFTNTKQFIHLVTSSTSTLPSDIWVPSSDKVKPQTSYQYALGYYRTFARGKYEASVEGYYKDLVNQIDYNENYVPDPAVEEENEFVFGKGQSYGAEFFLRKNTGKLRGWIGYTYSKSTREIAGVNSGESYPVKYDRTHDLSIVAMYDLSKKWEMSATFVYATGNAYTPATDFYFINNDLVTNYGDRNSAREESYHRMDYSISYLPTPKPKYSSKWTLSIYNLYNKHNPFLRFYDSETDFEAGTSSLKAIKVSIFPILPSISYQMTFNIKKKDA